MIHMCIYSYKYRNEFVHYVWISAITCIFRGSRYTCMCMSTYMCMRLTIMMMRVIYGYTYIFLNVYKCTYVCDNDDDDGGDMYVYMHIYE